MAIKTFSFLGYIIFIGGDALPPPPKDQSLSQEKTWKKENKLITHHIRQQNRNRMLRFMDKRMRYHV